MSLAQFKVMSAIETCRTAVLGGHLEGCEDCGHRRVAYNSCRNRHCPKCQGAAAREWLAAREADLLPVGYFHVVFTLPSDVAEIAFHNKATVYDLLFKAASETMTTIAADPQHLGARIGITAVLHTWGSAMMHHPHIHMIVPGGGISLDGQRWISSRPAFLLPVRVLSKLFRRLFLTRLCELHTSGQLQFFGAHAGLTNRRAFNRHLAPARKKSWIVYAKPPFSGPEAVLAYLSRYTQRVAISNHRLISFDKAEVTFRYKNYRQSGAERHRTMTLHADEFIRRFLLHVLPTGFHRIRHYGLLATGSRKASITRARELLAVPVTVAAPAADGSDPPAPKLRCPCCGGHMVVIDIFKPIPGTCAATLSPFSRNDGAVTRHGQIQSLLEVRPLRGWPCRACTSSKRRNPATVTPRSPDLPTWQRRIEAFEACPRTPLSRFNGRLSACCSLWHCTGCPKT